MEEIYKRYYQPFATYTKQNSTRQVKVMVPIDVQALADHFGLDVDIIFGRIYYHLNNKYSFKNDDGSKVNFFTFESGTEKHLIQFPLLASHIAALQEERNKFQKSFWLSIIAVAISVLSLLFSLARSLYCSLHPSPPK
jgi:hypothetical protein